MASAPALMDGLAVRHESYVSDQVRLTEGCDACASGVEAATVRVLTADGPVLLCTHHARRHSEVLERYQIETVAGGEGEQPPAPAREPEPVAASPSPAVAHGYYVCRRGSCGQAGGLRFSELNRSLHDAWHAKRGDA